MAKKLIFAAKTIFSMWRPKIFFSICYHKIFIFSLKKYLGIFLCSIYMLHNAIYLEQKNAEKFECKYCDIKCSKKSNYIKHLLTSKHSNATKCYINATQKEQKNATCPFCEKKFLHSSSMYRHKNICKNKSENNINQIFNNNVESNNNDKLVKYLMKENTELKHMIIDVCKNINNSQNNNSFNNTTYSNSNNKTFNLQFFLNETCKDAMNIMDFIDSIKLQLTDLENVGKLGYVEGISNIITSNLNALDITQRPIHCADKKRDVLYVKDENKWEKEDEQKKKIKKAIHRVACKTQRLISNFKEEHPDCLKSSSKFSDQYNKIIVESMGGSGNNDLEKEEKIIRNISKQVLIEKD